jgi:DNA polymerase III delta prime subunit
MHNRYGVGSVVDELYKSLKEVDGLNEEAKIKVYEKLGELERNLKLGTNPLIQLTSFLAFLWIVQYVKVPSKCPLIH